MIQHPAIISLMAGSIVSAALLVYAGRYALLVLKRWDMGSGSELQLELERRTYLVSSILSVIFLFHILSLFLFIFTADSLHTQFTGAMCAAGTLAVNRYGYPVLILKITNCLLAGVWLIINHTDTRGYDYPLVRPKYRLLMVLLPSVLLESVLQGLYFQNLKADVITSCCGSLFSTGRESVGGELAALPKVPMEAAFFGFMAATVIAGARSYARRKGGYLFPVLAGVTFAIAVISLISFICLYFYELPTHHCPFCILQREYGHVGYILYALLFGGGISGMGAGALTPFSGRRSLSRVIPVLQRRLAAVTVIFYLLFTLIVSWRMLFTPFRL